MEVDSTSKSEAAGQDAGEEIKQKTEETTEGQESKCSDVPALEEKVQIEKESSNKKDKGNNGLKLAFHSFFSKSVIIINLIKITTGFIANMFQQYSLPCVQCICLQIHK